MDIGIRMILKVHHRFFFLTVTVSSGSCLCGAAAPTETEAWGGGGTRVHVLNQRHAGVDVYSSPKGDVLHPFSGNCDQSGGGLGAAVAGPEGGGSSRRWPPAVI